MGGFLMSDDFVALSPSRVELNVASIVWGISIAFAIFTFAKGVRQTHHIFKRKKTILNPYVIMIWLEWMASLTISVMAWFFLFGAIVPSFALFFILLCMWTIQVQCIIQIIINRIALLVRDQTHIVRLQWGAGIFLGLINISVFCIWIPAMLQISPTWISINYIWDRVEKVIFCLVDLALNVYFIHLVRSKLIANGLRKYDRLYYFNIAMITVSLSLDVLLIGIMSLGQGTVYMQFHPLVYGIKLHIEMNLADLIAKIVRAEQGGYPSGSGSRTYANGPGKTHSTKGDLRGVRMQTLVTVNNDNMPDGLTGHSGLPTKGIQRTIETEVVHERKDEETASRSSSTAELQRKFGIE